MQPIIYYILIYCVEREFDPKSYVTTSKHSCDLQKKHLQQYGWRIILETMTQVLV
jgi:hypothetical protein